MAQIVSLAGKSPMEIVKMTSGPLAPSPEKPQSMYDRTLSAIGSKA